MLEENSISEAIARFDLLKGQRGRSPEEPIEWETAFAICEIVRSVRKIDEELLPSLVSARDGERADDALHEIREELRHVLYHIKDSTYLSIAESS